VKNTELLAQIQQAWETIVGKDSIENGDVARLRRSVLALADEIDPDGETDGYRTQLNRASTHTALTAPGGREAFLRTLQNAERVYRARHRP
jgi:hypothetical protein